MTEKEKMARVALRQALKVRQDADVAVTDPICVFDVAENKLKLEVKFRPEKSLSGMYSKGSKNVILISAHRPPGHRAFTCAHEVGHHMFGHGTRVDEYVESVERPWEKAPEEWIANRFASYLLMPLPAVIHAFKRRNWLPGSCDAMQAYTIACQLGVGYTTLVRQMSLTLKIMPNFHAEKLLKITPKEIRRQVLGDVESRHLVLVDKHWNAKVAVDLEVGDHLVLPSESKIEGASVLPSKRCLFGDVYTAGTPGKSRAELSQPDWATFIRVSKFQYTGRNIFRFLEDSDVNQPA